MDLIRESSLIQYFKREGREEGFEQGEKKARLKLSLKCWRFDLI